ncbi:MAG: FtsX-like permease family protein, partial [Gemmatimonadales bacterium]
PVFLALSDLEDAGLLTEGSLAQYRASLLVPDNQDPRDVARHLQERIGELDEDYARLSVRTAREEAEALAEGFQALSRFLGLSAFIALLLGGVGVAGAIQLYVEERLPGIAVLRCLGARQGMIFRSYLLQAGMLGAGGALLGVGLGVALQWGLPALLASVLPFRFEPGFRPASMLLGLTVGVGVTVLFALFPLLRVREVPPLAALRIDVEDASGRSRSARVLVGAALGIGVLLLATFQTGGIREGAALTGGLALVLLVLRGIAALLMRGVRGALIDSFPFAFRQGISGLFRPGNQTAVMLTALGFGAFLISSLFVVSTGLRDWLSVELSEDTPALFLFDVQSDQQAGVEALLARFGASSELLPVVPARLESIEGVGVEELERQGEIPGWTLRRVYRNTWSSELQSGDRITAGEWWDAERPDGTVGTDTTSPVDPVRISLEVDLARQLRVGLGSRVVWDVQGRSVESVITSLREVDWTRFQPNFFAVFEPGSLEGAPASWIGLAPLVEEEARISLQQELVREFPNVSFLDLSTIRETVLRVSGQVTRLLGAMAMVAVGGGFLVVAATLLSGRFRRRRESAILRTLGSSGRTLRVILVVEYLALGGLGGAAGVGLGAVGGAAVLRFAFDLPAAVPVLPLVGIWAVLVFLTLVVGWTSGGPVIRSTPRAVLGSAEG